MDNEERNEHFIDHSIIENLEVNSIPISATYRLLIRRGFDQIENIFRQRSIQESPFSKEYSATRFILRRLVEQARKCRATLKQTPYNAFYLKDIERQVIALCGQFRLTVMNVENELLSRNCSKLTIQHEAQFRNLTIPSDLKKPVYMKLNPYYDIVIKVNQSFASILSLAVICRSDMKCVRIIDNFRISIIFDWLHCAALNDYKPYNPSLNLPQSN